MLKTIKSVRLLGVPALLVVAALVSNNANSGLNATQESDSVVLASCSHEACAHAQPGVHRCVNKGLRSRGKITMKADRTSMVAGDTATITVLVEGYGTLNEAQLSVGVGPGVEITSGLSSEAISHEAGFSLQRSILVTKNETVPSSVFVTVRGRRTDTGEWATYSQHVNLDVPDALKASPKVFQGANGRLLTGDR